MNDFELNDTFDNFTFTTADNVARYEGRVVKLQYNQETNISFDDSIFLSASRTFSGYLDTQLNLPASNKNNSVERSSTSSRTQTSRSQNTHVNSLNDLSDWSLSENVDARTENEKHTGNSIPPADKEEKNESIFGSSQDDDNLNCGLLSEENVSDCSLINYSIEETSPQKIVQRDDFLHNLISKQTHATKISHSERVYPNNQLSTAGAKDNYNGDVSIKPNKKSFAFDDENDVLFKSNLGELNEGDNSCNRVSVDSNSKDNDGDVSTNGHLHFKDDCNSLDRDVSADGNLDFKDDCNVNDRDVSITANPITGNLSLIDNPVEYNSSCDEVSVLSHSNASINTINSSGEDLVVPEETLSADLSSWGLPDVILQKYEDKKIKRMFQWQVDCLTRPGVLDEHKNLVYSAPTSAGKTLVAEILAIKTVLERRKKVIFILPFVSVVREKMFYFKDILGTSGVRVEGFMGSYNPPGGFRKVNVAICTIEKANSLVNRLLDEGGLRDIGAVVVDEMHLLGDSSRGYLLELLLTKLRYMSLKEEDVNIQIIGMSATLPNLTLLADWLNAELFVTEFRPIPLFEQVIVQGEVYDNKFTPQRKLTQLPELQTDTDNVLQLCLETIECSCSVLIFCPSKNWCESLAQQISGAFFKIGSTKTEMGLKLRNQLKADLIMECLEQLKRCPVGLDTVLARTVSFGVAYHHAGLTIDERDILEGAFKSGCVRVLVATSTLSSGVNLPARRVLIRSPMFNGKPLDTLTYRQMIGRAGRMGKDTEGESLLICQKSDYKIAKELMSGNLRPVESCLEGAGKLKRAILEVITSDVASSPEEIELFTKCTLLASDPNTENEISNPIEDSIAFLIDNEFIRLRGDQSKYVATSLAKACLSSSLPPEEGLALFTELEKARQCFVLETELHLIYLVTPYSACNQFGNLDWMAYLEMWEKLPASMKRVGELVGVKVSYIINGTRGKIQTNTSKLYHRLQVHKRFYTALALQDLVNEIPLNTVAAKFGCNRGMLQSLQQSAATFAGMVTSFSKQLGWSSVELLVSQFQDRLQFGISRELLDLMKMPLLNAQRARILYNAGIEGLIDLANTDVFTLENILRKAKPFETEKEREGESSYDADKRNKLRTVWVTGKQGLTEREAAEMLVQDARDYLQLELGLKEAHWEDEQPDSRKNIKDDNDSDTSNSQQIHNNKKQRKNIKDDDESDTSNCEQINDKGTTKSKQFISRENKKSNKVEETGEVQTVGIKTACNKIPAVDDRGIKTGSNDVQTVAGIETERNGIQKEGNGIKKVKMKQRIKAANTPNEESKAVVAQTNSNTRQDEVKMGASDTLPKARRSERINVKESKPSNVGTLPKQAIEESAKRLDSIRGNRETPVDKSKNFNGITNGVNPKISGIKNENELHSQIGSASKNSALKNILLKQGTSNMGIKQDSKALNMKGTSKDTLENVEVNHNIQKETKASNNNGTSKEKQESKAINKNGTSKDSLENIEVNHNIKHESKALYKNGNSKDSLDNIIGIKPLESPTRVNVKTKKYDKQINKKMSISDDDLYGDLDLDINDFEDEMDDINAVHEKNHRKGNENIRPINKSEGITVKKLSECETKSTTAKISSKRRSSFFLDKTCMEQLDIQTNSPKQQFKSVGDRIKQELPKESPKNQAKRCVSSEVNCLKQDIKGKSAPIIKKEVISPCNVQPLENLKREVNSFNPGNSNNENRPIQHKSMKNEGNNADKPTINAQSHSAQFSAKANEHFDSNKKVISIDIEDEELEISTSSSFSLNISSAETKSHEVSISSNYQGKIADVSSQSLFEESFDMNSKFMHNISDIESKDQMRNKTDCNSQITLDVANDDDCQLPVDVDVESKTVGISKEIALGNKHASGRICKDVNKLVSDGVCKEISLSDFDTQFESQFLRDVSDMEKKVTEDITSGSAEFKPVESKRDSLDFDSKILQEISQLERQNNVVLLEANEMNGIVDKDTGKIANNRTALVSMKSSEVSKKLVPKESHSKTDKRTKNTLFDPTVLVKHEVENHPAINEAVTPKPINPSLNVLKNSDGNCEENIDLINTSTGSEDELMKSKKRTRCERDFNQVECSPMKKRKYAKARTQRSASLTIDRTFVISSEKNASSGNYSTIREEEELVDFTKFEVIDVCKDSKLFDCFKAELLKESEIAVALACERSEPVRTLIGIRKNDDKKAKTNAFTYKDIQLSGLAFCFGGNTAYYLDLNAGGISQEDRVGLLKRLFEDAQNGRRVRMFDAKEHIGVLKRCAGIEFNCLCDEPKIIDWLLEPEDREKSLKLMINTYTPEGDELCKMAGTSKGAGSIGLDLDSTIEPRIRCSIEAVLIWNLMHPLKNILAEKEEDLLHTYDIETNCLIILARIETTGFGVDMKELQNLADQVNSYLNAVEAKAYELAGRRFSFIRSTDVAKVLGIYKGKRINTNKKVLHKTETPLSNLILLWRRLNSALTKMVHPLLRLVENHRIHGRHITHSATGRISMQEPNLQNMPRDFEFEHPLSGEKVVLMCRRAFCAKEKNVLISADYCQLELRLLAHFSKDKVLCGIMRTDEDVFQLIAAKWNNISRNNVTELIRRQTKQICYGIIYGMGVRTLADQLCVEEEEALEFTETFHRKYPGIKQFINETVAQCQETGYVQTIGGRRRYLPHINDINPAIKSQAERQAVNTMIQGSAADIVKNVMTLIENKVRDKFKSSRNKPKMVLHLHDELIYEVPSKYRELFSKLLKRCMQDTIKLSVPFPVKVKTGPNWSDMKDYL